MRIGVTSALGLLALLQGCREPDSIVLVDVSAGAGVQAVTALRVTMSTPKVHDARMFPPKPSATPVAFPASLVLVVPRSRSGRLDLVVEGLDSSTKSIASGTAQTTIAVGHQTRVSVMLAGGAPLCGNRSLDPGEECDDGNLVSFDGCDFRCRLESAVADAGPADGGSDGLADAAHSDVASGLGPDSAARIDGLPPGSDASATAPDARLDTIGDQTHLPVGSPCIAGAQCSSTYCTDGVCCETACTSLCAICNLPTALGRCTPVPAGEDPRNSCPEDGQNTCGRDGTCDGDGACRLWADGTACAAAACVSGTASGARTCNGTGVCRPVVTRACAPYACRGTICGTQCSGTGDCAPSAYCQSGTCQDKVGLGGTCTSSTQCASHYCVRNFQGDWVCSQSLGSCPSSCPDTCTCSANTCSC